MTIAPGASLGPYEIVAPLGAGGMGEVWRARDTRLGRDVAVKVLPGALAEDRDAFSRFEREARAVASLSHPHILAIHDFGRSDGTAYAVMELLEGETLRQRLQQGPIPLRKALELARDIAEGLAAAHERGVVHRDLKPENLFLTRDGRVKILDFGLAKVTSAAATPDATSAPTRTVDTEPGTVLGTAGYMSPEQVRGLAVDHRTDVFSFGAVLYEMLSGRRAFRGETGADTMAKILNEDPPELLGSGTKIPAAVDRVVRHCLEKNAAERFQSARDLGFALASVQEMSGSGAAVPVEGRRPRRVPAWLALAAGLVAGAALALVVAGALRTPPEPPTFRYLTYSGSDRAPSVSPDGRSVAFVSSRDGTPRIWLRQLGSGAEIALTSGPDDHPHFSPDGSTILFARTEGSGSALFRVAAVGGEARRVIDDAFEGVFSPDGRRIAFLRPRPSGPDSSVLCAVDAGGGPVTELTHFTRGTSITGFRWSPDGAWIAAGCVHGGNVSGSILLVATDGKGAVRTMPLAVATAMQPSPTFSGKDALLYSRFESAAATWGASASSVMLQRIGETTARTLLSSAGTINAMDVAAPGTLVLDLLASRENLHELTLSGAANGPSHWLTRGNAIDRQPAYSPDGEWVIFSSSRSGNLDLWTVSPRTGAVRQVTDDRAEDWDPAFTPDGKGIVFTSNRSGHFEIWTARTDGSNAHLVSHDGEDAENATIGADGVTVVYGSFKVGSIGVWRTRLDRDEAVRVYAGQCYWPEVSPDGRWVSFAEASTIGRTLTGSTGRVVTVRVVSVADGRLTRFEVPLQSPLGYAGRSRWMPDGRTLLFVGMDDQGAHHVYAQRFDPDADTTATRRLVVPADRDAPIETFGISPDGRRITIGTSELISSLVLAEGVAGVEPPHR